MTDAYYRDRQLLLECLLRKPNLVSRHYPDLYRRVGALLAREDGTEAEHAALGAEHAALAAEVQDVLDHVAPRSALTVTQGHDHLWFFRSSNYQSRESCGFLVVFYDAG